MTSAPTGRWLAIGPAAAATRRRVGPLAWALLEELATRADVQAGVVTANLRDLAACLGVGKDTAAYALRRLRQAGLAAPSDGRGEGGRFGPGRYELHVDGLIVLGLAAPTGASAPPLAADPEPEPPWPAAPDMVIPAAVDRDVDRAPVAVTKAMPAGSRPVRRAKREAAAARVCEQLDLLAVAPETGAGLAASVSATPPREQP